MTERIVPPPRAHRGAVATDDHVARPGARSPHQPTTGLDPTADDEHLSSPSQGMRPEPTPATEVEPGT